MNKPAMFDFNEIDDFDKHIGLSIPGYEAMNELVLRYADYMIESGTNVYDIGCSTGALLERLPVFKGSTYYGIDNSNLMPFVSEQEHIQYLNVDLVKFDMYANASLITSIFTLQFLPQSVREKVLARVKDALLPGGGFIVCEKVFSESAKTQAITNSVYYEAKRKHFSGDEILIKEKELRSNMRIKALGDLMDELRQIGTPEVFWKSYNFVGVLVIRD